ncbi:hypothetical protein LCGC14_0275840 [marine sediment metagenome]|uniref:Uncharacterized protein n=1 Tax=marine sediment metagenome TaxID=412755 RepID=A0A0F9UEL8_9ZZZZ
MFNTMLRQVISLLWEIRPGLDDKDAETLSATVKMLCRYLSSDLRDRLSKPPAHSPKEAATFLSNITLSMAIDLLCMIRPDLAEGDEKALTNLVEVLRRNHRERHTKEAT